MTRQKKQSTEASVRVIDQNIKEASLGANEVARNGGELAKGANEVASGGRNFAHDCRSFDSTRQGRASLSPVADPTPILPDHSDRALLPLPIRDTEEAFPPYRTKRFSRRGARDNLVSGLRDRPMCPCGSRPADRVPRHHPPRSAWSHNPRRSHDLLPRMRHTIFARPL